MSSKAVVACIVGLLAIMALPAAHAGDGTPNLGTAQVSQVDSRWFVDARVFGTDDPQDTLDNTTLSIGFTSPINAKTGFSLMYSGFSNIGTDPINGAVRRSERDALAVAVKRQISGQGGNSTLSFTIGADAAIDTATGMNIANGAIAYQDDFTPAARLQMEWGSPGSTQWQLAGQVALWDTILETNAGVTMPGFGSVYAIGGGVVKPFSSKLTLSGDVMIPFSSDNVVNDATNLLDNQLIWSAGGTWDLGGRFNSNVSIYATNSMAPTLGSSIIGAPDNSVAFGATFRRDF